ncbi:diacylglycerol kinase family protein [Hydrogenibacillus schlegelii]|uniref:DAGKc domain-containing protein n=1 Tax=Hydrogenibacillus schlegelii TaxID=1484 RepID=A0A179IQ77_HYDSH|nr:diacylglycerol kinase family protein [Hydrogenibacillus schlegelii]OAR04826.1 hypothetical protein SA87_07545 [Hydrogenibacillus schlegelii]
MFAFLLNPTAGAGRSVRIWRRLETALKRRGIPYELLVGRDARGAFDLAREAAGDRRVEALVAVGGDGTLSLVLNAVMDARTEGAANRAAAQAGTPLPGADRNGPAPALALIPAGSGNDVARTFGIPRHPERALERLLAAPERAIDVGRLRIMTPGSGPEAPVYFFGFTGAGIDAAVIDAVEALAFKKRFQRIAYALGVVKAWSTFRPFPVTIELEDGRLRFDDAWLIVLANIPFLGGGMHIAPGAEVADGAFDLVVVSGIGRLGFLRAFPLVFRGRHIRHPSVTVRRVQKAVLTFGERPRGTGAARRPVGLQRDGEREEGLSVAVDVLPKAIRFRA